MMKSFLQMLLGKEINVSDGQLLMILLSMIRMFLQMLLQKEINVSHEQLLMILGSMIRIFSANVTTERN